MTSPIASLQAAREECAAALLIQKRKVSELAAELAGVLAALAKRYAQELKLRARLAGLPELTGADRDAETMRALAEVDALIAAIVADCDAIRPVLRQFQNWAAGLEIALAGLNGACATCPPLARPRLGRGDAAVMRNDPSAQEESARLAEAYDDHPNHLTRPEPETAREWLTVFLRSFLPPVWRLPPQARKSMAIFSLSDVRTLEQSCRAHWFAQKERRLCLRALRIRAAKAVFLRIAQHLRFQRPSPNLHPRSASTTPAGPVS